LTVVPVSHNRQARYLVVGTGLGMSSLKKMLPALKRTLHKLSCTFQILWLRSQVLASEPAGDHPAAG